MLVKPDFSEVAAEITAGTYRGRIRKGEVKAWADGKAYVNWEIETVGSPEPKDNGRRIFHKTAVSGRGAFMLQKFYRAATGQPLTGAFDTEQLVGKEVILELVDGVNRTTSEPTGYVEVKNVRPVS